MESLQLSQVLADLSNLGVAVRFPHPPTDITIYYHHHIDIDFRSQRPQLPLLAPTLSNLSDHEQNWPRRPYRQRSISPTPLDLPAFTAPGLPKASSTSSDAAS